MKKNRIISLVLTVCMLLASFACQNNDGNAKTDSNASSVSGSESSAAPSADRNAVAVKLGDIEITAGEIEDNYNGYMQMMSYYGMSAPTDDASIDEYVQMIIEELISQQLPLWKATESGIKLSDEELKQVDLDAHNDTDAEYADLLLSYAAYFAEASNAESVSDLTEDQKATALEALNADIREYYNDSTTDLDVYLSDAYDNYYKQHLTTAYSDKLRSQSDETISVDDATVEKWYADTLAEQKELFDSDPSSYRTHHDSLALDDSIGPLLYVPEGLALVKLITLTPEGETPASFTENTKKMADLESEYGKLALTGGDPERMTQITDEYSALSAENKKVEDEFFAQVRSSAEAAYNRLVSGESFDTVATEATGAAPIVHVIWYAGEDYNFTSAVRDSVAAMKEDTFSEVLFDGKSYYIVYLVGKLTPGAVDRAPIAEAISAAAAVESRDAAWEKMLAAWKEEALKAATFYKDAYAYVGR